MGHTNAHEFVEHIRDFPKVNVLCAVSVSKGYGPFFFAKQTVTGVVYLDMLQQWLMPELQEDAIGFILQDGALTNFFWKCR